MPPTIDHDQFARLIILVLFVLILFFVHVIIFYRLLVSNEASEPAPVWLGGRRAKSV